MKTNAKLNLIIIGVLFVLLSTSTTNLSYITDNNNKSLGYSYGFTLDKDNLKISEVSGKIHIDNNWTAAKAAGICTGNGTYSEPYVIEDLVIDGEGSGNCILIGNSDAYFEIENCTVYNSGAGYYEFFAGIKLYNCTNGLLINNNCSSNEIGLWISGDNNTISGNMANNNDRFGIWIASANNTISGNMANNNYYHGISVTGTYNKVLGNTASYNSDSGIWLSGKYGGTSGYCIVSENIINHNKDGVRLFRFTRNNISRNIASDNRENGIHLYSSRNNNISKNYVDHNWGNGIFLESTSELFHKSNDNKISENNINANDVGIKLSDSHSNSILNNKLFDNKECILEENCEYNIFENNDCGEGDGLISGYNLFFLLGFLFVVATLLLIRRRRKIVE